MNTTFPIISNKPPYLLKRCKTSNRNGNKNSRSIPTEDVVTTSPKAKRAKNDFNLNTSLIMESPLEGDKIKKMVSENAVVVFGSFGCCMCHVVKQLLQGLGANLLVQEIEDSDLKYSDRNYCQFPVVFIGGELYGGLDHVISTHISGELVPMLKQAGALWL